MLPTFLSYVIPNSHESLSCVLAFRLGFCLLFPPSPCSQEPGCRPKGRPRKKPSVGEAESSAALKSVLWHIKGSSASAKAAKVRVEMSMSEERAPEVQDIKEVMRARRLKGRKELLVRILKERFGKYGRCVPLEGGGGIEFVTNCSVERLGTFLLEQYREGLGDAWDER